MNKPQLNIVLPCYNPTVGWLENIAKSLQQIEQYTGSIELIIVNDGSTTTNTEECIAFFAAYPHIKFHSYTTNKGKGYALREGVKQAKGELIIYTDIDFPYTQQSFEHIHEALKAGADVAIGIRGKDYYTHLPKARIYISKFLRFLIRTMLRIPTDDTQCGLKGFNQKGKNVFLQTTINRYLFDLEFIFLSSKQKLNIQTVEVELRPDIQLSTMRISVLLHEGVNFLSVLWRRLY